MNDLLSAIKAQAQEMAGELSALRRDFHQHPELSHQEARTARVVADYLSNLGLEVRTGIAHTGVVGVLQDFTNDQEALQAASQRDWITGFISRGYDPVVRIQDPTATIHGKPAEELLKLWFNQLRQTP